MFCFAFYWKNFHISIHNTNIKFLAEFELKLLWLLGKERSLSPSHRIKRPSDLNGIGVEGQSEEADTSSNDGSNVSSNPGPNYRKLQSPIIPREHFQHS